MGKQSKTIHVEANGEQRVDWRVKVKREGESVIRMLALSDSESDAIIASMPHTGARPGIRLSPSMPWPTIHIQTPVLY